MLAKSALRQQPTFGNTISAYGRYLSSRYVAPALVVIALVGVAFGAIEVNNYINAQHLTQHFTTISGKVTGKAAAVSSQQAATGTLQYEFVLADGSTHTQDAVVSPKFWSSVGVGSTIRVVYDQQKPSINYINGFQPTAAKAKVSIIFSAAVVVIALALLAYVRFRH